MSRFCSVPALMVTLAGVVLVPCGRLRADILRYADFVKAYEEGSGAQFGYTEANAAIGQPGTGHTPQAPQNNDPVTEEPIVVSLGQQGSITLGFDQPVIDHPASSNNTRGYDLLIWGNTFQSGLVITPERECGRFQEQGFVEVAQADAGGEPIEWFLILPRIYYDPVKYDPDRPGPVPRDFAPAELLVPQLGQSGEHLASGDLSISAARFDGFADCVPMQGSVLETVITSNDLADVVLDDPATYNIEGLGGTGIDLSRAVLQASPGVPELLEDEFQFVNVGHIDLLRITDAKPDDVHPGVLGPITTEIDGVIVLPDLRGCNDPFADADGDDDVDQSDFGLWQTCHTGDGGTMSDPRCECFDRDGDGDVDAFDDDGTDDLSAFEICAATSGPGIAASKDCDGP